MEGNRFVSSYDYSRYGGYGANDGASTTGAAGGYGDAGGYGGGSFANYVNSGGYMEEQQIGSQQKPFSEKGCSIDCNPFKLIVFQKPRDNKLSSLPQ